MPLKNHFDRDLVYPVSLSLEGEHNVTSVRVYGYDPSAQRERRIYEGPVPAELLCCTWKYYRVIIGSTDAHFMLVSQGAATVQIHVRERKGVLTVYTTSVLCRG